MHGRTHEVVVLLVSGAEQMNKDKLSLALALDGPSCSGT